ncbi:MAG: hypothetical protein M3442_07820 [Chloroflexota bacterium]|nr:hypothetical protein [Chloroflexota bacterium]
MEDEVASRLLDWALRLTDDSIVRHCGGGERGTVAIEADADPAATPAADPDAVAYDAADQARRLLDAVAAQWRGHSPAEVAANVAPLLGPPLFDSPLDGQEAVEAALATPEGLSDGTQGEGPTEQPPEEPLDQEAAEREGAPGDGMGPGHS